MSVHVAGLHDRPSLGLEMVSSVPSPSLSQTLIKLVFFVSKLERF